MDFDCAFGIDQDHDEKERINQGVIKSDSSETYFHSIVGCIEDIVMDDEFTKVHSDFMEKYWSYFEDVEENKFIYFDIFQKYNEEIEKYIENELGKRIENFDMEQFEKELHKRKSELEGEIFEMLATFTDFIAFKEKFLEYRAMKEGKLEDFSQCFTISKF